jgi:hypothetical protein
MEAVPSDFIIKIAQYTSRPRMALLTEVVLHGE